MAVATMEWFILKHGFILKYIRFVFRLGQNHQSCFDESWGHIKCKKILQKDLDEFQQHVRPSLYRPSSPPHASKASG